MSNGEKKNGIWICDEWFPVAGKNVKVVTFKDDPYWDFAKSTAPSGVDRDRYVFDRKLKTKGGMKTVRTLEDAAQVVDLILMHADGMTKAHDTHRVLLNGGLSTHFCIDWDGTIYQCADPGFHGTLHGGLQNMRSVGIDLCNDMVELHKQNKPYPYPDDQKAEWPKYKRPTSPVLKIQNRPKQTYGYTDPQYVGTIELFKVLCDALNIPKQPPLDERMEVPMSMLEDADGFQGFAAHWHTAATRWDPGPGFDWQRVYHALRGEHNSFPIVLEDGQNIADLLVPTKVEDAARRVYDNTEQGGSGYFPIGLNQNWHGGIHLHAGRGTEVRAMCDGVLAAARVGNKHSKYGADTELGDNNFILLRHDIPMPKAKEPLRVFSLYMHLQGYEVDKANPAYDWMTGAFRVHKGEEEDSVEALDLGGGEDENAEALPDVEPEDDSIEEDEGLDERHRKPYLDSGLAISALRAGKVALFDVEDENRLIKIKSGEVIGTVGRFRGGRDISDMIHVEVFADANWKEAIDLGVHSRHWVEIEEDVESNLRVETRDVLSLFGQNARRRNRRSFFRRVHRQVLPREVEDFYAMRGENEQARAWLRKAITRHVSEWSDQVDWVRALADAQVWSEKVRQFDELFQDRGGRQRKGVFSDEIKKFLPFIWLNSDVAAHIGLKTDEWNGVLYHFHPIHFLLWLTFHSSSRVKALSAGKSVRALRKERTKQRKKAEEERIEGPVLENVEAYHEDDDEWMNELEEESVEEVLNEYFGGRPEADEWKRPTGRSEE